MEVVKLHYKMLGAGPPLVILHGLFGSLDNWQSMARQLATTYQVICPDLRNHGRSPWSSVMDYAHMAADVLFLADELGLSKFLIAGHSMGGKVALELLNISSQRIESAMVFDIAPKKYKRGHDEIFHAMFSLNLTDIKTRQEADEALKEQIQDWPVRQFILKNLDRDQNGNFFWKINLSVLHKSYENIIEHVFPSSKVNTNIVFVKGSKSTYITKDDEADILTHYPKAKFEMIDGAGHWLHADKPEALLQVMLQYLSYGKAEI